MGQPSEAGTCKNSKRDEFVTMGTFKPSKACALGKVKKVNVSKLPNDRATKLGERLFIDIASPTAVDLGGNNYWLLLVNDYSLGFEGKK